jgi:uracil-DNA glycosylase
MEVRIEESWKRELADIFDGAAFAATAAFTRKEYAAGEVYPPASRIFAAFDACPFPEVKVVILGQDPYHGPGQANGLSFSVNPGVRFPPSLLNIFKEVSADTGAPMPVDGDLSRWARQGVLMLNATLTVAANRAGSHQGHGWEQFTDAVIKRLSDRREHLVFILWGSYAIRKSELIDQSRHLILTSPHPSPLSAHRGFFGNHHFSRANAYLQAHGATPIVW